MRMARVPFLIPRQKKVNSQWAMYMVKVSILLYEGINTAFTVMLSIYYLLYDYQCRPYLLYVSCIVETNTVLSVL